MRGADPCLTSEPTKSVELLVVELVISEAIQNWHFPPSEKANHVLNAANVAGEDKQISLGVPDDPMPPWEAPQEF